VRFFCSFLIERMRGARASETNERCADSRDFARFYGSHEQPSLFVSRERDKKEKNERNWMNILFVLFL
jgi:hypothetical protein